MNASKFLISATAAMAVVGAIGFANAQTTDTTTTTPATNQQMNQTTTPGTMGVQDRSGTPSGSTLNNTRTQSDSAITDMAPQTDRN